MVLSLKRTKSLFAIHIVALIFFIFLIYNSLRAGNETGDLNFLEDHGSAENETIHLVILCVGLETTRRAALMLKSILVSRLTQAPGFDFDIHLHILTQPPQDVVLEILLHSWRAKALHYTIYHLQDSVGIVNSIKTSHSAGRNTMLKLLAPNLINQAVSKVILLDTDIIFLSDIWYLWKIFNSFNKHQTLAMAMDKDPQYRKYLLKQFGPIPGNASNSGVILLHLNRLRTRNWSLLWLEALTLANKTGWLWAPDQDVYNLILKLHPEMYYQLPCYWNTQVYFSTENLRCPLSWQPFGSKQLLINPLPAALHVAGNLKYGLEVAKNVITPGLLQFVISYVDIQRIYLSEANRIAAFPSEKFQNPESENSSGLLFNLFMTFNRNSSHSKDRLPFDDYADRKTLLSDLGHYRIHPLHTADDTFVSKRHTADFENIKIACHRRNAVTLIIHKTYKLFNTIKDAALLWSGPISVSIYLNESNELDFIKKQKTTPVFIERRNILFHLIYATGSRYPSLLMQLLASSFLTTLYRLHLTGGEGYLKPSLLGWLNSCICSMAAGREVDRVSAMSDDTWPIIVIPLNSTHSSLHHENVQCLEANKSRCSCHLSKISSLIDCMRIVSNYSVALLIPTQKTTIQLKTLRPFNASLFRDLCSQGKLKFMASHP